MTTRTDIFNQMLEKWPSPVVVNTAVREFTGGAVSGKTIQNLRAKGEPVPDSMMIGGKRAYVAESLVDWLRHRSQKGAHNGRT